MADDADNINNQARKMRTNYLAQLPRAGHNWVNDVKNKRKRQTASWPRPQCAVGGARAA